MAIIDTARSAEPHRYLPDPALIPPCPRCGDRERVIRMVCGLPAQLPLPEERDRVEFMVCPRDDHPAADGWWCPDCHAGYSGIVDAA